MNPIQSLCRCLLMLMCLSLWTGCLFTEVPGGPDCDAARRCAPADAQVCGVDGESYACELYATCLGVSIDPSGAACGPTTCSTLGCGVDCPDGFVQDANGCDTCECVSPPVCSDALCALDCEYGFEVGPNGCSTCTCAPPPACLPVACDLACEYGFEVDETGCETCSCVEPPACPDIDCPAEDCPGGRVIDESGCETCQCADITCEPLACPEPAVCPNGYADDEFGCPTCDCAQTECPYIQCELYCEFGHKVDANGCELCACEEPPDCVRDEDCGLMQACRELDVALGCCKDGETCPNNIPVCPKVCTPLPRCDQGAECPRGTICSVTRRRDCCFPGDLCEQGVPMCPALCI